MGDDRPRTPSRWQRFATAYGVVVTAALYPYLPDLMQVTGLKGGILTAGFLAPMLLTGALQARALLDRRVLPLVALVVHLIASVTWSEHSLDGAIKSFSAATTLAWAAMFLSQPTLVGVALRWTFRYCALASALNVVGVTAVPMPSYLVALFGLFGLLHRNFERLDAPAAHVELASVAEGALYLGVVFFSTFRAPTLGALTGVLLTSGRLRESRALFVAAVVAGALFFTFAPRGEANYAGEIHRHDLVGRYTSAGDDRLSGRQDIWTGVIDDIKTTPAWLPFGNGIGDVDYYVAAVNRDISMTAARGEPALSPHNLFLEVFLALGLAGLVPLGWAVATVLRNATLDGPDGALAVGVLSVSLANVTLLDSAGGTLCIGLLFALVASAPRRRVRAWAELRPPRALGAAV